MYYNYRIWYDAEKKFVIFPAYISFNPSFISMWIKKWNETKSSKNNNSNKTNNYFWFIWYIMIFINFERKTIEQSIWWIFNKKKRTPQFGPNMYGCYHFYWYIHWRQRQTNKNTTKLVFNSMENKTKTAILFISNHLD